MDLVDAPMNIVDEKPVVFIPLNSGDGRKWKNRLFFNYQTLVSVFFTTQKYHAIKKQFQR